MRQIKEDNLLGKCFRHKLMLTKAVVSGKDYRCTDCKHAFKYPRPFWEFNPTVLKYLAKKSKKLIAYETKRGNKALRLVNA